MQNQTFDNQPCPIARSVAVMGDAWSILILRDAHAGIKRFDGFRKSLGIAPTILTKRLATLTAQGLLQKEQYSERPPREEYLLTTAGRDLLPVLFALGEWGRIHCGGGELTRFFDAQNGTEIKPVVIDEATGAKIGTRPMTVLSPDES